MVRLGTQVRCYFYEQEIQGYGDLIMLEKWEKYQQIYKLIALIQIQS